MKELIFGLDCVRGALSTNRRQVYKLLAYQSTEKPASNNCAAVDIFDLARKRSIPIQYTTRKELDILLQDRPHQVKLFLSLMLLQSNRLRMSLWKFLNLNRP